ncbi:MAG: hypothetical protein RR075_01935 [Pygmaiobacter sp.]
MREFIDKIVVHECSEPWKNKITRNGLMSTSTLWARFRAEKSRRIQ